MMSTTPEVKEHETDKRKIDQSDGDVKKFKSNDDFGTHPGWNSLESFKFVKILRDDAQSKTVCVHATASMDSIEPAPAGDGSTEADAIILMEKTAFDTSDRGIETLISSQTAVKPLFNNDIYGTYHSIPADDVSHLKTVIIFPATAKHMEKYLSHDSQIIYETPDQYRSITLPYIESSSFEMQWIYNILEKKKESEFIIYEDPDPETGYILIPDLKWDRKSTDTMYLSGIVHKHGIKSLRDLTSEHLPLLRNIQDTALKAIEKEYGIDKSRIRAYFHYQPSYYHLHVHFNQLKHIAPGSNVIGAHLLADVIDNIEMYPDYYQRKTLAFSVKENALLYKCYKNALKE